MDKARWTVVIPYYNEENYLAATLDSLKAQTMRPFRLHLVDNASTDGSRALARAVMADAPGIDVHHFDEAKPGQAHALKTGIDAAETEFIAICDADTLYPPHYLGTAERLLKAGGPDRVAALAMGITAAPDSLAGRLHRMKGPIVARLLPRQCHSGGYAHTFKTAALRAAGGYDKALWPYVLKDHEMIHRVLKQGNLVYSADFWCRANDRRGDRGAVRWTLAERLLYHLTPYAAKDWFFYSFLKKRFEQRKMDEIKLRAQSWHGPKG